MEKKLVKIGKIILVILSLFLIVVLLMVKFMPDRKENLHNFKIIEEKFYDIPAIARYSVRATLDTSAKKEDYLQWIEVLKKTAKEHRYTYHKEPRSIFIYLYADTVSDNSGNWYCMYSLVDGKEYGVQWNK